MKKLLIIPVLFVLAGCAGTTETRATVGLGIVCSTYAVALEQLTPYVADGTLSDSNLDRMIAANGVVDPFCLPGSILDPAVGVFVVKDAITLLRNLKETV